MPPSKLMRALSLLLLLLSLPNAIKVLKDPAALRFFGIALGVVAVAAIVGSVVAVGIVAVRRWSAE
jgi:hypothetical protein